MRKIVVVLGSPRKNGNSAILSNSAIEGIIAANVFIVETNHKIVTFTTVGTTGAQIVKMPYNI